MTIRWIEAKDVQEIAGWEREIAILSFGNEAVTDIAFHVRKLEKAMVRERSGMFVWEADKCLAGWMWLSSRENSVTQEAYMQFRSFYVHKVYRGTFGVDDLFKAGIQWAISEGCQHIVGHVQVHNLPMRALYKKYGFAPTHLTMEYRASTAEGEERRD